MAHPAPGKRIVTGLWVMLLLMWLFVTGTVGFIGRTGLLLMGGAHFLEFVVVFGAIRLRSPVWEHLLPTMVFGLLCVACARAPVAPALAIPRCPPVLTAPPPPLLLLLLLLLLPLLFGGVKALAPALPAGQEAEAEAVRMNRLVRRETTSCSNVSGTSFGKRQAARHANDYYAYLLPQTSSSGDQSGYAHSCMQVG